MKNILTILLLLIGGQCALAQQDTIVYYKNHAPQATSQDADYQVIVRQKNKKISILQECSWKDNKWEVDKTEIIKLKKNGRYHINDGASHYKRSYKKIEGGYEVEEFNYVGKLRYKGLSRSMFPLHRVGQWQNLYNNKIVGISVYNNETMTKSYIIANNKHLPNNTYANADSLATYKNGKESYSKDLIRNVKYPVLSQENGITGRVLVLFAIDVNGSPSDIQILKGVDHHLNKAAVVAVKSCKDWTPAFKDGKPVKVYTIAPINFNLQ